ncbi:hypothetical protein RDWZM_000672 [Blomia tropicalis]|uniref:UBX domain-containing protein n=1 Tax=Blomia tropicalis TaxID=40697 RepID=A0A9Q0MAS7_BLOTA|nr:hypothetical protein RDWZM_000672 [Blomia tropicalis]
MENQNETNHDETITQFISITGAEENIAKNTLEACNWNVEMAINMYVDSNFSASSSTTNRPVVDPEPQRFEPIESDEIRPPIPPVRQVLVEDYPGPYNFRRNTSYDAFRNFEQETRWQEQQLLDDQSSSSSDNSRKTFEDLFRPPLDLIFRGNFEMAKFEGQQQKKWLMVNIQNPDIFSCQVLNRDVWSNHTVKSILNEHFIFWQSYHNNSEGQKYINFYNVRTYPYVSIVDPRTGEKMVSWNEIDTMTFCDNITQFLSEHPRPGGDAESVSSNHVEVEKEIVNDSEEMLLEAAINASLTDITGNGFDHQTQETSKEHWKNYLGSDLSPKIEVVIRYPDGARENAIFPSTSKMKALFLYVSEKGFNVEEYDLITNFPKKNLSNCNVNDTLENVGIHSRDTLYVQMKN